MTVIANSPEAGIPGQGQPVGSALMPAAQNEQSTLGRPVRPGVSKSRPSRRKSSWRYSDSLILRVLRAVCDLTQPPCPECSTREVLSRLQDAGCAGLSIHCLGTHMGRMCRAGLIHSQAGRQFYLWSLTEKGYRQLASTGSANGALLNGLGGRTHLPQNEPNPECRGGSST
jgi:hypothetical protein